MGYRETIADLIAAGIPAEALIDAIKAEVDKAAREEKLNKVRADLCLSIMNYAKELEPDVTFSAEDRKNLEEVILDFEDQFARLMELRKEIPVKKDSSPDETIKRFLKLRGLV